MSKLTSTLLLLVLLCCALYAQAPTGIITGTVTDESGAVVPNATVTITNKATGFARTVTSSASGLYSAAALPAGEYEVRVEMTGFRTMLRDATVLAGETTTVNAPMQVGGTKDVVTVEAATAQINYDTHNIQGVIEHSSIEDLPLNGRSYMQLAVIEPGVTIAPGSTAQFNALFTVSVLGSGNHTVYTIDGGNVSDNIDTAGGISSMNFPQETVQEFQISTVNFDLSTSINAGGAINVVTRSGSNDWHGSGYFFFRDHNMAAYPALKRPCDPTARNPLCGDPSQTSKLENPFFARRNPGVSIGGPVKKDKFFFFFNFEHTNQVQALVVQGNLPSLSQLAGTFSTPYSGKLLTSRLDYRFSPKHSLFVRYSHDGNNGFGDVFSNGNPSNWVHNTNWSDQGIIGLTSLLTPAIVNDIRFQYNYWNNHNNPSTAADCQFPCIGTGVPELLTILGSNFAFGNAAIGPNVNAPQARNTRRFELVEAVNWQKGTHRLKFGGDMNPTKSAGLWGFCTPACVGAFSPEYVRGVLGNATAAALFPKLPTVITSDADLLNLPLLALPSGIFTGIGVGSVSLPAPYDYNQNKHYDQWRAYFQDTWKIRPNFTLNYGVAWNAQTGFYNSDLRKPAYLAPIFGANNLDATGNNLHEFQPAFGFAWSPGKSGKTVIRGGAGLYWDGTPGYYKLREPAVIGPLGDARVTLSPSSLTNTFQGILNLSAGGVPLPVGAPLPLSSLTTMTVGQFMQILNAQVPVIQSQILTTPPRSGAYTTTNVDVTKTGVEIYPPGHNPLPRSYQTSIGIQRDLGHDLVLTADWARRQGENVSLGELDVNLYNRFINGVAAPVIPACKPAQLFKAGEECSSGSITQWTYQGRSVYQGLLVKLQKRFSHRYQLNVNYALQSLYGQTAWNLLDWGAGYGPTLARHNLGFSGIVNLPWGFQLGFSSSMISRSPIVPTVPNIALLGTDINGSQPLTGLKYGCLNAGCDKSDLASAVNNWNSTLAGTKDSKNQTIPQLKLPSDYQLGDPTISQDLRVSKIFTFRERYKFTVLGEVFNLFNIANLSGYAFSLDTLAANPAQQTVSFGQPTQRAFQTFGSGGPRAIQIGARFTF